MISAALNNAKVFGTQYKCVSLLEDVASLQEVLGLGKALRQLKSKLRSTESLKGFRYEIEGAAKLARDGKDVGGVKVFL
jgi:hypothetical protein